MFEWLVIGCAAAFMLQGTCVPDRVAVDGEKKVIVPDGYEQMIAPQTFQLSYSASGHDFDRAALTAYWRQRAGALCAGEFRGYPTTQTRLPEAGYDQMISASFLSGTRTYALEAYGVAYCTGRGG